MNISFSKYHGTGNDFIIIDNRLNTIQLTTEQINFLCNRKFGIGADGLMLLQNSNTNDFEMKYYNADGKEGSMCGNGGRCIVQFAHDNGLIKDNYLFLAVDGVHEASFNKDKTIRLKMQDVTFVEHRADGSFVLDTGSPHFVKQIKQLNEFNVVQEGKNIRYSNEFKQNGINVNFVQPITNDTIQVRTYERGVEDETLSCGTGVTASALVFAANENGLYKIFINTLGGNLSVEFFKENNHTYKNIWLCGSATFIFTGCITI
ncbi:MAG: diaminopimelate epimerase [Chitinophagaceae bacterium]|nr:diaminopimelate epimerase [Chitinophagaceae bacterium]MCW5904974.1 diaminopimelate epimerase [Chitinophagaceae bacterium]